MNPNLLIDAIVHQTMVLIGQLATSAGIRAPLSHIADQVFLELVRELETQGVRQKVVADMFGMALRTYQKKIQRLSQSATERGRTLWEAIYDYIAQNRIASRLDVMQRFARDEEATVRGILRDMVANGLLFESGTGLRVAYRVATDEDLSMLAGSDSEGDEAATFVWAAIYRYGPVTLSQLLETLHMDSGRLRRLVELLVADGRIQFESGPADPAAQATDIEARYRAARFIVPLDARLGWAAAVFDHYQAVVRTILAKLAGDDPEAPYTGRAGGSTWSFDIWHGHPYEQDVLSLLSQIRGSIAEVQQRVFAHNDREGRPATYSRLTFYCGQSVSQVSLEDSRS